MPETYLDDFGNDVAEPPSFGGDDYLDDNGELVKAKPQPQESLFQRVLGAGARGSDYLLGAGARGIAAIEEPVVRGLARARGVEYAPATQRMLESVQDLRAKGERMQAGESTYGHELAENVPVPESGVMGHVMGGVKAGVEFSGDMARDPVTWLAASGFVKAGQGASAVAKLAGAGTAAQRVASVAPAALGSAMFTVQAGQAVTPALLEAQRLYDEAGGWTPQVTEKVANAVLMTGAAALGGIHSIKSAGRVVEAALPDRGGMAYRNDPNAKPTDVEALDAEAAAQAARKVEADAADVARIESAGKRLEFERSAALEKQGKPTEQAPIDPLVDPLPEPKVVPIKAALPEAPDVGSPQAMAVDRVLARAQEGLARGVEPAVGRVGDLGTARVRGGKGPEYQGPVGQADIAPHERAALQTRLLELWQDEGGAVEAQRPGPAARTPEAATPSVWEKAGRAFVRTIEPAFQAQERMPGVGRELAGRERAYVRDWEVVKGGLDSEATRALKSVGLDPKNPKAMAENPLSNQLYRYLDGLEPIEALPEAARPAAQALHAIQQKLAAAKVERGIIDKADVLEFHWPRKTTAPESFGLKAKAEAEAVKRGITYEQALSDLQEGRSQITGVRSSRKVTSSQTRNEVGGLKEGEYRTDFGAFFDDIKESAREIAEHDHLGKNGQIGLNLANKLEPGSLDHRFAIKLLDRLRGAEQQGVGAKVSSAIRSIQSGIGLVASPITQFGTITNTAAETSVGATAKAVADTFLKAPPGPDGKPMNWSKPIKRMRAAMSEARLDAERQGATNASVAEGLTDYYLKTAGKGGGLSNAVGRLWHIRGVGWSDNLMRVIASKTAPHIVPEAWKAAKGGDVTAQRTLDKWHVDWRKDALTPEMLDTAARRISERSQFKVGMGDIPLWASSPWGKVAFQFQSFGYAHTQFVGGAIDEARRGNVKPLAKLMTLGAGMGYLTAESKRALFGGQAPEDPTEEDFAKAAQAAFAKGRHYDPTKGEYLGVPGAKGAALAYIEGLGAAGGVGALLSLGERVASGSPAKIALGATGGDVEALARAGAELSQGNVGKATGRAVEGMLPTGPLGINPRAAMREALSEEPNPNPGYAGRAIDIAQGKPGATLRTYFPGQGVSDERKAAGELRAAQKRDKSNRDAMDREFPVEKVKKPIEKRAAEAQRKAARSDAWTAIARAINSQNEAAVDAALDRAYEAGFEFDEGPLENLKRRVLMRLPPLEPPPEEN